MSENDEGIYIDCQPVDINGDDIPEIKTHNKIIFKPLEDVFDLNKTALFFALNDLARVRHSYHWHNQRFYYNYENKKLEFIAYDCYAGIEEGIEDVIYGFSDSNSKCLQTSYLSKQFFNNAEFLKHYKSYLNKVS